MISRAAEIYKHFSKLSDKIFERAGTEWWEEQVVRWYARTIGNFLRILWNKHEIDKTATDNEPRFKSDTRDVFLSIEINMASWWLAANEIQILYFLRFENNITRSRGWLYCSYIKKWKLRTCTRISCRWRLNREEQLNWLDQTFGRSSREVKNSAKQSRITVSEFFFV